MSLGESTFQLNAQGGQQRQSSANLAKAIVGIGCSPKGAVNTLIPIGNPSQIDALLDQNCELAEWSALTARDGQTRYVMPVAASTAGGVSASVAHVGNGAGTITPTVAPHKQIMVKCIGGGTLGTATFQFSLDGGVTWSATIASVGGGTWVYTPVGTYCALTFNAATYVATKTLTVGIDGTVTPGAAWVGTVTQASSPMDAYEVFITVVKGGALGTAVLVVSLDNGRSQLSNVLVPVAGVVVVAGTGLVLTCANAFTAGDTYSFLAIGPAPSTSDVNAALTALKAIKNVQFTQVHLISMPASAAGAYSLAATLETALEDAFNNYQLDWDGMSECPSSLAGMGYGDIVLSGSNAIRDTADTDAVIKAARAADTNLTGIHVGSYPITSPLTGRHQLRPLGWAVADRYVDTVPSEDISALQPYGALRIYITPGATSIGRDEYATPGLDDVQLNTARTYRGRNGVFLSITSGGAGWKNCTTQATYQDKGFMRIVHTSVAQLRPIAQDLLGQRPATNKDGTIAEKPARQYDLKLDGAFKRFTGLVPGGDFTTPQASLATASVLRSSQLGQAPKRLDVAYTLQSLGFISAVANAFTFSGVVTVNGQ